MSDGWSDKEHDVEWLKMQESYGGVVYAQGEAIWTAKNIIVDRNYVFENVNQQQLDPIDSLTALALP